MFTGIVTDLAAIDNLDPSPGGARLTVTGRLPHDVALGDSIAVDGACLTVTSLEEVTDDVTRFTADLMPATLEKTTLGARAAGDRVNLEPALAANGRFGGHVVTGHVDAVADVIAREHGELADQVTIALPAHLGRYVVPQGSIALDGVSLTVAALDAEPDRTLVTIGLIPATLAATTLGHREAGDRVNVEVDVLAKHVERLIAAKDAARA